MATGAWYDPDDPAASAPLERHGNPNVLTADIGTSRLSQGPSVNCLVDIRPEPAPPAPGWNDPPLFSRR